MTTTTPTPWGNVEALRERRLRPGPGADREAVQTNQRERLLGGMVGAVAENGYEGTRVSDVVHLSGVSRSAFYNHFDDRLDCFLATLDELAKLTRARLAAVVDPELAGERRVRAIFDAIAELVVEQPAAARVCLVEIHAAGPLAAARLEQGVAVLEKAVARAFEQSPERAGMPRDLVRAIVGGIHKTVHTRLRSGREDELPEVMGQLVDWALSYRPPPEPLRRPRRKPDRGAAPHADTVLPRERLVTAVIDLIAERGYPETTIIEIAERASASLSTFYGKFENKEGALLAAIERERDHSLAATRHAYDAQPDWPIAVRDGVDALFGYFASEPATASIGLIHAYAGGPAAIAQADKAIWAFHAFLEPGRARARKAPPIVPEAICNAVYSLAAAQVRAGKGERMRELTPVATYATLMPFVGAEQAYATLAAA